MSNTDAELFPGHLMSFTVASLFFFSLSLFSYVSSSNTSLFFFSYHVFPARKLLKFSPYRGIGLFLFSFILPFAYLSLYFLRALSFFLYFVFMSTFRFYCISFHKGIFLVLVIDKNVSLQKIWKTGKNIFRYWGSLHKSP